MTLLGSVLRTNARKVVGILNTSAKSFLPASILACLDKALGVIDRPKTTV